MEAENVINLFDSYWYEIDFFKKIKPKKNNEISKIPLLQNSNISNIPTIYTKYTNNDGQIISSNSKINDFSASPNSVLQQSSPKLQTIFSGKNLKEFDDDNDDLKANSCESSLMGNNNLVKLQKRKKKRLSKSLSDLEFEELKGFMDLGFVFSEDDKDSILASIIPGLQRFGKPVSNNSALTLADNINNNNNNSVDTNNVIGGDKVVKGDTYELSSNPVMRPYLSEAWEVLEKKKKENSMPIKWKVPASTNQIDMKDYLKSWAHNVASTVK